MLGMASLPALDLLAEIVAVLDDEGTVGALRRPDFCGFCSISTNFHVVSCDSLVSSYSKFELPSCFLFS